MELNMDHITNEVSKATVNLFNVSQKSKEFKDYKAVGFNSKNNSIILEKNI